MTELEDLRDDLRGLRLSLRRLENTIEKLLLKEEGCEMSNASSIATTVTPREEDFQIKDRYGNLLHVGDTVKFLTRGRFASKTGKIYKISDNNERVTSRDSLGKSIST